MATKMRTIVQKMSIEWDEDFDMKCKNFCIFFTFLFKISEKYISYFIRTFYIVFFFLQNSHYVNHQCEPDTYRSLTIFKNRSSLQSMGNLFREMGCMRRHGSLLLLEKFMIIFTLKVPQPFWRQKTIHIRPYT